MSITIKQSQGYLITSKYHIGKVVYWNLISAIKIGLSLGQGAHNQSRDGGKGL